MRTIRCSPIGRGLALAVTILFASAAPSACKKDGKADENSSTEKGAGTMVSPSAEGSKYDPPVKKEQIPDGAWMCDMGTVHFAASEKGNGTCELCGMPLVQKGAKAAPHAAETKTPSSDEKASADDAATADSQDAAPAEPAGEHGGHSH